RKISPSIGLSQRLLNRDHHKEYHEGAPRGPRGEPLRRHGDEVQRLPGGYWQAHGRADDTMNLGGIKVSSLELERVMDKHPDAYQTAAVAVIPPEGGADHLVVFVVPRPGAAPPDAKALRAGLQDLVKRDLNPLYRIHDVVLVDALPRTASNKIMRRELRRQYGQRGPAGA
ncbi:MAG TPA: AMP-dependent synthetase, partial [Candidatus Thermoplasmatota archaeon]|nr:AMP-dependent synthetase [Candidatus Thermoplasmatota archaeon]